MGKLGRFLFLAPLSVSLSGERPNGKIGLSLNARKFCIICPVQDRTFLPPQSTILRRSLLVSRRLALAGASHNFPSRSAAVLTCGQALMWRVTAYGGEKFKMQCVCMQSPFYVVITPKDRWEIHDLRLSGTATQGFYESSEFSHTKGIQNFKSLKRSDS